MRPRKKLKISCRNVDCEKGLHCYKLMKSEAVKAFNQRSTHIAATMSGGENRRTFGAPVEIPVDDRGEPKAGPVKACKVCGAKLVDWERVRKQSIADAEYTFEALKTEWIRHWFWHWPLEEMTIDYAKKKGKDALRERVKARIHSAIGKSAADKLWRDGHQTPFADKPNRYNLIFCAQHATASCCRACAEEWHGIPLDRPLTLEEEEYLTELAMRYIDDRLPELNRRTSHLPQTPSVDILLDEELNATISDKSPVPRGVSRGPAMQPHVEKKRARRRHAS
jgi:hypothetical protein